MKVGEHTILAVEIALTIISIITISLFMLAFPVYTKWSIYVLMNCKAFGVYYVTEKYYSEEHGSYIAVYNITMEDYARNPSTVKNMTPVLIIYAPEPARGLFYTFYHPKYGEIINYTDSKPYREYIKAIKFCEIRKENALEYAWKERWNGTIFYNTPKPIMIIAVLSPGIMLFLMFALIAVTSIEEDLKHERK